MILGSGETNIVGATTFELGNNYKPYDIVFFSGFTYQNTEFPANSSSSGHYYYTGAAATSTCHNAPNVTSCVWAKNFFSIPSYGSQVTFESNFYKTDYGDGYYSLMNKSVNALKAKFDLKINKITDAEAKAVVHLLEDSFNYSDKPSGGYSGIYWTPFEPYNQSLEFYVDTFSRSYDYPDVNSVSVVFSNNDRFIGDWENLYIPSGNTSGYWQSNVYYNQDDIVYLSGDGYNRLQSGWYYFSGENAQLSSSSNSPQLDSSEWTKKVFYWDLNKGVSFDETPRVLKNISINDFEIRSKDGLNKELWNVKFTLQARTDKEAKAILHFLEKHRGVDPFKFTLPAPYNKEKVFVCPTWQHMLNYKDNNDISVSFMEQVIDYTDDSPDFLNLITVDPYLPTW